MPESHLDHRSRRRAMRLALVEGLCYAAMVGLGETWFVAFGVHLGASVAEIGLLVGVPLGAGALGSMLSLALFRRLGRRKPLVLGGVAAQVAVLAGMPALQRIEASIPALVAAAAFYQVAGQLAGTAWASWFGDLVPNRIRGRYFARRTRSVHLVTFASMLLGGGLLQVLQPGDEVASGSGSVAGFVVIFASAALMRSISVALLALSPEPAAHRLASPRALLRFLSTRKGANAGRLLVLAAALNLSVYAASPYFTPFMLKELHFSYLAFTAASAVLVLAKVLTLTRWGRVIDQHGPRTVYLLALCLITLIPVPWLWASGIAWVLVAQAFSGFSWAAYEIANFTLLLECSYRRVRPLLFAAHNTVVAAMQLLACLVVQVLGPQGAALYRTLFLASIGGRLLVALVAPRQIRALRSVVAISYRQVLLRVTGFRPSGGLAHRPVLVVGETDRAGGGSSGSKPR
jgi:MFS family permease